MARKTSLFGGRKDDAPEQPTEAAPEPTFQTVPEFQPESQPEPEPQPETTVEAQPESAPASPEQNSPETPEQNPTNEQQSEKNGRRKKAPHYSASALGLIQSAPVSEDKWEESGSSRGRNREFNPFDELLKRSFEDDIVLQAVVENDEMAERAIRNSANFLDLGVEVRWEKDQPKGGPYTMLFKARKRIKRTRKSKTQTEDATAVNASHASDAIPYTV